MLSLRRGPFPGKEIEVDAVAGHEDAPLLLGEPQQRSIGKAREPDVRDDREDVVPESAQWIADPCWREVGVEEQPHPATSSVYATHSMNG